MRHFYIPASAFVAFALLSCGGGDLVLPSEGEPAEITILDGNDQSGRVGEALAKPLLFEVLDGVDRPVPNAMVVVDIEGAVAEPDTLTTDASGQATTAITLGSTVGATSGALRVVAPESPATVEAGFTVTAVAASANGLALVSGDAQTGVAGTPLTNPLVVQVTDGFGNPISGVTIGWTVESGSVSAPTSTTDESGLASVFRTLGPTAGAQTTTATSEGLAGSPLVFTHTAVSGSPSGVLIVAGDDQTGPPRTTLPLDLVVAVVDADGNPVTSAPVTWVVTGGGGTLDPATGTTDAEGRARTKWTLGSAVGANTAQAVVSGVGQAEFTATAAAGTASSIQIVSGNNQNGQAGARLGADLVVLVLDDSDNPVAGVPVTWTVQAGGGSVVPTSGATGADGRASTAWSLGPSTGRQRVQASAPGAGNVRFEATAAAGAPSTLALVTAPSATAQAGVAFGRQPEVQVRDASGNPVQAPGVSITAAIATGPGQVVGTATATTGPNGRATFSNLGVGGATGTHTLIFAASGFTSVTSGPIEVGPASTTTTITADTPDPSLPAEGVVVTFQVTSPAGTPTGTVQVTASGGVETCSAEVAAGSCSIVLVTPGDRTLTATFPGGGLFQSSSATAGHVVTPPEVPPPGQ